MTSDDTPPPVSSGGGGKIPPKGAVTGSGPLPWEPGGALAVAGLALLIGARRHRPGSV